MTDIDKAHADAIIEDRQRALVVFTPQGPVSCTVWQAMALIQNHATWSAQNAYVGRERDAWSVIAPPVDKAWNNLIDAAYAYAPKGTGVTKATVHLELPALLADAHQRSTPVAEEPQVLFRVEVLVGDLANSMCGQWKVDGEFETADGRIDAIARRNRRLTDGEYADARVVEYSTTIKVLTDAV